MIKIGVIPAHENLAKKLASLMGEYTMGVMSDRKRSLVFVPEGVKTRIKIVLDLKTGQAIFTDGAMVNCFAKFDRSQTKKFIVGSESAQK